MSWHPSIMVTQSPPRPSPNLATKPRPSPINATRSGLSSVRDAVGSPQGIGSTVVSMSLSGLDALQLVCEAVNTLPCIKYIAQISMTVLKIIEEVQLTNEAVRKIAIRAKDIVLAVAKACSAAPEEICGQLESDLQQLTEAMSGILEFTQEISSRSTYRKFRHKGDDAAAVKSLDTQLTHAFQLFEIQSNVSIRIAQQQMVHRLAGMSSSTPHIPLQTRPRLVTGTPLHITEGLYLICSAADGRVIETEHRRPVPNACHALVAPSSDGLSPYQIWVVSSKNGKETDYTIRNFATGASLDVHRAPSAKGDQVICSSNHAGPSQTWSFYGSNAGNLIDYCTIRSHGSAAILDSHCPAVSDCNYLHMTSPQAAHSPCASQQWSLTRIPFPFTPSPPMKPHSSFAVGLARRRFVLQNMASGNFASVRQSNGTSPNVFMQNNFQAASSWHFEYQQVANHDGRHDDMFAVVTGAPPSGLSTLDYFGAKHIAANPGAYHPTSGFHLWKAIPAPKDGAFCFLHSVTGRLLSHSPKSSLMDASDATALHDPTCQWRLLDASTGSICPVLYDSSLAVPPADFADPMHLPDQPRDIPESLILRTGVASATTCRLFADGLKREHTMMRDMLSTGIAAIVLAPRLLTGRKLGVGLYDVTIRDDEPTLGLPSQFRGKGCFQKYSIQMPRVVVYQA